MLRRKMKKEKKRKRTSSKSTPISSSESEPPSMVKSIAVSLILAVLEEREGGSVSETNFDGGVIPKARFSFLFHSDNPPDLTKKDNKGIHTRLWEFTEGLEVPGLVSVVLVNDVHLVLLVVPHTQQHNVTLSTNTD
jgi:hypothetical protein